MHQNPSTNEVDEDLNVDRLINSVRDIRSRLHESEKIRKHVEDTLMNIEKFNLSILDSLPAHIAVLDESGNIIYVNKSWIQFAHENGAYSDESIGIGMNYFSVCESAHGDRSCEAVGALEGMPTADTTTLLNCIHAKYTEIGSAAHTHTLGDNVLLIYDDNLDPGLDPVNGATPYQITAALETYGTDQYVKFVLPVHATVPTVAYQSYGRINAWRLFEQSDTTVTVHMEKEPTDPALATKVELDTPSFAVPQIEAQLNLQVPGALAAFDTPQYPLPSEAKAKESLRTRAAAYLQPLKFPVYSPQSGDPSIVLSTPVGFLLVADGVLAILMNRRDSSVPDYAPDNFLGSEQLALAIGKARAYEVIAEGIEKQYPDLAVVDSSGPLKCQGNQAVHEPEGGPIRP